MKLTIELDLPDHGSLLTGPWTAQYFADHIHCFTMEFKRPHQWVITDHVRQGVNKRKFVYPFWPLYDYLWETQHAKGLLNRHELELPKELPYVPTP